MGKRLAQIVLIIVIIIALATPIVVMSVGLAVVSWIQSEYGGVIRVIDTANKVIEFFSDIADSVLGTLGFLSSQDEEARKKDIEEIRALVKGDLDAGIEPLPLAYFALIIDTEKIPKENWSTLADDLRKEVKAKKSWDEILGERGKKATINKVEAGGYVNPNAFIPFPDPGDYSKYINDKASHLSGGKFGVHKSIKGVMFRDGVGKDIDHGVLREAKIAYSIDAGNPIPEIYIYAVFRSGLYRMAGPVEQGEGAYHQAAKFWRDSKWNNGSEYYYASWEKTARSVMDTLSKKPANKENVEEFWKLVNNSTYVYGPPIAPGEPTAKIVSWFLEKRDWKMVNGRKVKLAGNKIRYHKGVDIATAAGVPLLAVSSGKILDEGYSETMGYYVKISHEDGDMISVYMHMLRDAVVSTGQSVEMGQVIGAVGNTGSSGGNHLHIEIRQVDGYVALNPKDYIDMSVYPISWRNTGAEPDYEALVEEGKNK